VEETRPGSVEAIGPEWTTRTVMVFEGQSDTHIKTGEDYETRSLGELFIMEPGCTAKGEGLAFVPSSYHDFDGRNHKAQRTHGSFVALTGDIDKGDHPLSRVEGLVRGFCGDGAFLIYSSAHARVGDRRWRVILPLEQPAGFDEWHDAQIAFFDFMEFSGVPVDRAMARAGQPVFLPNVPPTHTKSGEALRDDRGEPLYYQRSTSGTTARGLKLDSGPAAAWLATLYKRRADDDLERDRIRREAEARRARHPISDGTSIIEEFNRTTSIATMLEMCGYEQSPRNSDDWRSPHQTGESYATRIMGDKWVSLSESDAAAKVGASFKGGCFGDAYDLFVHYQYKNDTKAAFNALRQEKRDAEKRYQPDYIPQHDEDWEIDPETGDPVGEAIHDYADDDLTPSAPATEAAEATEQAQAEDVPLLLPIIDIGRWLDGNPPERLFAWGTNIPLNTTTMLTGPGGVGKSLFEQMLCTCIALGVPFLGIPTRQMNTLYVTCEDDEDELWRRQAGICGALGVPFDALMGKLHLVSLCGAENTALATFDENEQIVITERWRQLVRTCEEMQIQLYAFDNATDAMAGDLNNIHQVAEFVNLLTGLAIRMQGAAMILHHPNKAGDDWLGSVAWHNKVRARLIIKRSDVDGDPDGRVLENPKANYGPSGSTLNFRWLKGAFVADSELPDDVAQEMYESIQASADNKIFLACLTERNRQRRAVSESRYGQNYAAKVFEQMPESKRIGKERLERAMDRLFRINAIERGFLWVNRGEGKAIHGLREVGREVPESSAEAGKKFRKPSDNLPETYPESFRKHTDNLPETSSPHTLGTTYHTGSPAEGGEPCLEERDGE